MVLIYLDVDGVLNDHKPLKNSYCGMKESCIDALASILDSIPEARIVVSSAWRYMMLSGDISCRGFEYLLCVFGMPYETINGRVVGFTESDDQTAVELGIREPGADLDYLWLKENGCELRAVQIERDFAGRDATGFVVLDDLDLGIPQLVQTNPNKGLDDNLADRAFERLLACMEEVPERMTSGQFAAMQEVTP